MYLILYFSSEDEFSITPSSGVKDSFLKKESSLEISSEYPKPDPSHFNLDSDTDVEEDEVPVAKNELEMKMAVKAEVDPVHLHMDSDTDVEEEQEASKSISNPDVSDSSAKLDTVNPRALIMEELVSPSTSKAVSEQPTSSTEFHVDSDTDDDDVDVPVNTKTPADPHAEFYLDSDTDVENDEQTTQNISTHHKDPLERSKAAEALIDPKIPQSDSDTDVEDEKNDIRTPTVAKSSLLEIDSTSEMSSDPQYSSPAKMQHEKKLDFFMDSDTDVEEEDEGKSSTPRDAGR